MIGVCNQGTITNISEVMGAGIEQTNKQVEVEQLKADIEYKCLISAAGWK